VDDAIGFAYMIRASMLVITQYYIMMGICQGMSLCCTPCDSTPVVIVILMSQCFVVLWDGRWT